MVELFLAPGAGEIITGITTSAGEIRRTHAKNLATVHLLPDMNTLAPSEAFASFLTCMCDHGQGMSGGDTRCVSNAKVKAFFALPSGARSPSSRSWPSRKRTRGPLALGRRLLGFYVVPSVDRCASRNIFGSCVFGETCYTFTISSSRFMCTRIFFF